MSNVFCLTGPDGRPLAPSLQATVLAKYSRSPLSAKDTLASLTSEEADKFHEKWVIEFGHNSVAELATIPVCLEGISIIASKVVEQSQRAAYSEKSTRYQRFSGDSFVTPPGGPPTMKMFARRMYEAYDKLYGPMVRRCAILMGKDPDDPKVMSSPVVKARAFDSLRYLLPAGTGTNVAYVVNLRDARDMVSMMRGHQNPEIREIGDKILAAASEVCPVLMRHADPNVFEPAIRSLGTPSDLFNPESPSWYVDLIRSSPCDKLADDIRSMYDMDWDAFCKHMSARPEHSEVPNIFKTISVEFDVLMDYGAFRDLQRHRRCEQYSEPLTTQYGYVVPDDISGSELEEEYVSAMELVDSYTDEVMYDANLAQYVIPLGYLHRSRFQMSLKELYYIVELRTTPRGHISYRRVAYEMFSLARKRYSNLDLMQWCRACMPAGIGEHK